MEFQKAVYSLTSKENWNTLKGFSKNNWSK
jgi:hypothetical protein